MEAREQPDKGLSWVVFRIGKGAYAVPAGNVREMLALPKVIALPRAPAFIRGVVNLRGRIIPLLDLRLRLGLVSSLTERDELVSNLNDREQDHLDWLAELEASVEEGREFRLTTDPHKCKFGLWYDTYTTDNHELASVLRRFDDPHREIHHLGLEVRGLVDSGETDRARELIERTRTHALARMIKLFGEVRGILLKKSREIALVLERGGNLLALAVDAVESVEALNSEQVEMVPAQALEQADGLFSHLCRRGNDKGMLLMMDVDLLLGEGEGLVSADPASPPEI